MLSRADDDPVVARLGHAVLPRVCEITIMNTAIRSHASKPAAACQPVHAASRAAVSDRRLTFVHNHYSHLFPIAPVGREHREALVDNGGGLHRTDVGRRGMRLGR
jgi:hypothetical protein